MIGRNIKARPYMVVKTSPALSEFSGKIKTSFWDFSQFIRLAQHEIRKDGDCRKKP